MRNLNTLKILLVSCATSLVFWACKSQNNKDENPAEKRTALYSNARIVGTTASSNLGTNYSIASGSNLVFDRYYKAKENKLVMDDEYDEHFAFQVDPSSNSFTFSDASLAEVNPVLGYNCYCPKHDSLHRLLGTITGTKQGSNGWNVDVDLQFVFLDKINKQDSLAAFRYDTLVVKFKEFYASIH